jgi:hypothetical protein
MLQLKGKPSSVTTFSTDFSFQNLVFGNLFEFSAAEITQNQYLPHSESKSYQINSIKSCSSKSSQQHQRHIPIPPKYSATKKSFNIHMPWNQAHVPLLIKSFPKTPRTQSEASQFSGSDNYKTNYLPS